MPFIGGALTAASSEASLFANVDPPGGIAVLIQSFKTYSGGPESCCYDKASSS